jgi:hypothetical protein
LLMPARAAVAVVVRRAGFRHQQQRYGLEDMTGLDSGFIVD